MALALRAIAATFRLTSSGSYTPVETVSHWPRHDGQPPTLDLSVRAHRMNNRDRKAAAVYLRKHAILDRGR